MPLFDRCNQNLSTDGNVKINSVALMGGKVPSKMSTGSKAALKTFRWSSEFQKLQREIFL